MLGSKTSMASVTIEEKRLRQLKQQLFGKEQPLGKEAPAHKIQSAPDSPAVKQFHAQTVSIDSTLLKKDFTKIISFSIHNKLLILVFTLNFYSMDVARYNCGIRKSLCIGHRA